MKKLKLLSLFGVTAAATLSLTGISASAASLTESLDKIDVLKEYLTISNDTYDVYYVDRIDVSYYDEDSEGTPTGGVTCVTIGDRDYYLSGDYMGIENYLFHFKNGLEQYSLANVGDVEDLDPIYFPLVDSKTCIDVVLSSYTDTEAAQMKDETMIPKLYQYGAGTNYTWQELTNTAIGNDCMAFELYDTNTLIMNEFDKDYMYLKIASSADQYYVFPIETVSYDAFKHYNSVENLLGIKSVNLVNSNESLFDLKHYEQYAGIQDVFYLHCLEAGQVFTYDEIYPLGIEIEFIEALLPGDYVLFNDAYLTSDNYLQAYLKNVELYDYENEEWIETNINHDVYMSESILTVENPVSKISISFGCDDDEIETAISEFIFKFGICKENVWNMTKSPYGKLTDSSDTYYFAEYDYESVVVDEAPVISSNINYISNVDRPLSEDYILSTVTATDDTDTDVTISIDSTDYDATKVGTYTMIIKATDDAGNYSIQELIIHVVDITAPVVSEVNPYGMSNDKLVNIYDNQVLLDIIDSNVAFSDNYYVNYNDFTFRLVNDYYSDDYTKAGTCNVEISITDGSGNETRCTIPFVVYDVVKPVWVETEDVIEWTNASQISREKILSYFTAEDESCIPTVSINDDHMEYFSGTNWKVARTYTFEIIAEDKAGNQITKNLSLVVSDVTAPVITGNNEYTVSYNSKLEVSDIISKLTATDETAKNLTITAATDNYSNEYSELGAHTIKFKTSDGVNESALYTVTINVIDNIKPTISGVTTLNTSNVEDGYLSKAALIDMFKIEDKTNYTVELVDHNDYMNNQSKVGTYNFTLTATDETEYKNEQSINFTLAVADKIAPVISIKDKTYVIVTDINVEITREDIIALLTQTAAITIAAEVYSIESNYFDAEELEPATYTCAVTLSSGDELQVSLCTVENELVEDMPVGKINVNDLNFFQKIWAHIVSGWNKFLQWCSGVKSFFQNFGDIFEGLDWKNIKDWNLGERLKAAWTKTQKDYSHHFFDNKYYDPEDDTEETVESTVPAESSVVLESSAAPSI